MSSERGQLYSGFAEIAAGSGGHIANILSAYSAGEGFKILPEVTRILQPFVDVDIHPIVGLIAMSVVYNAIVMDGMRKVINSANVHFRAPTSIK